jgi:hypothetical protein
MLLTTEQSDLTDGSDTRRSAQEFLSVPQTLRPSALHPHHRYLHCSQE